MKSDLVRAQECLQQGDIASAVRRLDAVLRSAPKHVDAMILQAHAAVALKDIEGGIAWLQRAAKVSPHRADIHSEIGRVYLDRLKQASLAAKAFRRAIDIDPNQVDALYHLGKAVFELGDADQALSLFRRARDLAAADGRADAVALCRQSIAVMIPGAPSVDNAEILAARREWLASLAASNEPSAGVARFANRDRSLDRPLAIGYVSSFFDHENWMKPVWGLLNEHDRESFQVRVFSFGPVPGGENPGSDANSAWRPHESDRIFDVAGLTNEALAEVITDEKIDVLVDLNGYSDPKRLGLFRLRPAPVAAGWFNMYATTGLSCYDLLSGDRHVVRPDEEVHYSEPIARVPGSYLTFRVGYPVPNVAELPCIKAGHLTLGSLASRYKITPAVIDAWCEILRRAPATRLLLRNGGLEAESERRYLKAEFERRGVKTARVELLGRAPHFEFLETYDRIDIALDTFPYNGGTTTTEAIWQGVPVVALAGTTWAGRTSTSILREAGLGEWVADDLSGYIELAARAANSPQSPQKLAEQRHSLRGRLAVSPVCDTAGFARAMESLYRQAWRKWCHRRESPP